MTDRRLKGLWISPHFFECILRKEHIYISKSPIPKDAQFQGAYWIPEHGEFFVIYFSSDFPIVPEGEKIPSFVGGEFYWEELQ